MLRNCVIALALSAWGVTGVAAGETAAAQSQEQVKSTAATPETAGNDSAGAKLQGCSAVQQDTCAANLTPTLAAANNKPAREEWTARAETPVAPAAPTAAAALTGSSAHGSSGHNWRGFYIGGNLGGIWGEFNGPLAIAAVPGEQAATTPFKVSSTSFVGCGQAGYNWEISPIVFGIEGDFNGRNVSGKQTLGASAPPAFVPGDFFSARSHWESSIRGRFGLAWGSWLLYATGGVAFARASVNANFIVAGIFPASSGSDANTLVGGTGGAGLEAALTNHWSIGAEYRYAGYQSTNFHLGTVAAFGPPFELAAVTGNVDLHTHDGVVKVNYKF